MGRKPGGKGMGVFEAVNLELYQVYKVTRALLNANGGKARKPRKQV